MPSYDHWSLSDELLLLPFALKSSTSPFVTSSRVVLDFWMTAGMSYVTPAARSETVAFPLFEDTSVTSFSFPFAEPIEALASPSSDTVTSVEMALLGE